MKKNTTSYRIFVASVIMVVSASAVYGLWLSGSPEQERMRRLDGQRISDLQQITYAVDNYWEQKHALPATLTELQTTRDVYISSIRDPKTQTPYEYRPSGKIDEYFLCATFETDAKDTTQNKLAPYMAPARDNVGFWNHAVGRACFSVTVRDPQGKPFFAPSVPL